MAIVNQEDHQKNQIIDIQSQLVMLKI